MVTLLWAAVGLLLCVILCLLLRLCLLQRSADEICAALSRWLAEDTNTLIDVSTHDPHLRRLAAELNRQLRQLRRERQRYQQGDLELKEAVTNISHDLRTPLTAICGYLDLLEDEEKSEAAARYVTLIAGRAQALKQLTEELFRYSMVASAQELRPENVNLGSALEESLLTFYGAMRQAGITPRIQMPERPVLRSLDTTALNRIFSNIIGNAVKYSDGDLSVAMGEDGTVTFANTTQKLTAVTAARLFDRFYTVETSRNSTGLGLSIAKHLTEQMGGKIEADYRDYTLSITVSFPEKN